MGGALGAAMVMIFATVIGIIFNKIKTNSDKKNALIKDGINAYGKKSTNNFEYEGNYYDADVLLQTYNNRFYSRKIKELCEIKRDYDKVMENNTDPFVKLEYQAILNQINEKEKLKHA